MTDAIEAAAKAAYERRTKGLSNCYVWGDPCLYAEHPDTVDAIYAETRAAVIDFLRNWEPSKEAMIAAAEAYRSPLMWDGILKAAAKVEADRLEERNG